MIEDFVPESISIASTKVLCFVSGDDARFFPAEPEKEQQKNRYNVLRGLRWKTDYDDLLRTEKDQYDFAPTIQFICVTKDYSKILGGIRLIRMHDRFMLDEEFNNIADPYKSLIWPDFKLPKEPEAAEMSRLIVRKEFMKPKSGLDVFKNARDGTIARLFVAMMAYCLDSRERPHNQWNFEPDDVVIDKIFGVSYVDAWGPVFASRGLHPTYIGPDILLPPEEEKNPSFDDVALNAEHVQAAYVRPSWKAIRELCEKHNIRKPYLYTNGEPQHDYGYGDHIFIGM